MDVAADEVAFVMFDAVMADAVTVGAAIADADELYFVAVADDVAEPETEHLVEVVLAEFAFVVDSVAVLVIVLVIEAGIVNAIEIVVIVEPEIVEAVAAMNAAVASLATAILLVAADATDVVVVAEEANVAVVDAAVAAAIAVDVAVVVAAAELYHHQYDFALHVA